MALQDDGTYVVTTHAALRALVFDPRLSSEDLPDATHPPTGNPFKDWIVNPIKDRIRSRHRPLIFRDPPDHDVLRRHVMREFTAVRVNAMHARVDALVADLLDRKREARQIDLVDDFSYPLPVTVICEMLGVPPEDEARFHGWATQLATALEPDAREDKENLSLIHI